MSHAGDPAAVSAGRSFFGGDHQHNPLVMGHIAVGRAGSWAANQPATWFEYIASDLPIPIWTQIVLLVAAFLAAARLLSMPAAVGPTARDAVALDALSGGVVATASPLASSVVSGGALCAPAGPATF